MKTNKEIIEEIAFDVECELKMVGLSTGLYLEFAMEVAKKYSIHQKKEMKEKILNMTFKSSLIGIKTDSKQIGIDIIKELDL